jgi:hypothetical protein
LRIVGLDAAGVEAHALLGHVLARRVAQAVFHVGQVVLAAPHRQRADALVAVVEPDHAAGDDVGDVQRLRQVAHQDAQEVVAARTRRRVVIERSATSASVPRRLHRTAALPVFLAHGPAPGR